MSPRTTQPTTAEERSRWRNPDRQDSVLQRLLDDADERDEAIARRIRLTLLLEIGKARANEAIARAEKAEAERDALYEQLSEDLGMIDDNHPDEPVLRGHPRLKAMVLYLMQERDALRALVQQLNAKLDASHGDRCVACGATIPSVDALHAQVAALRETLRWHVRQYGIEDADAPIVQDLLDGTTTTAQALAAIRRTVWEEAAQVAEYGGCNLGGCYQTEHGNVCPVGIAAALRARAAQEKGEAT